MGRSVGRALVGTGSVLAAISLFVPWYDPTSMFIENWAVPFLGVQIAFLGQYLAGVVVLMFVAVAMNLRPPLAFAASLAVLATAGTFVLLRDPLYDATWVLWKGGPVCTQCSWGLGPGALIAVAGGGLALLGAIIVRRRSSTTAAAPPP